MATHPSVLAWEVPWTEEPGGLQLMGSQRVRREVMKRSTHFNNLCSWGKCYDKKQTFKKMLLSSYYLSFKCLLELGCFFCLFVF